ncbi:FimV/HubP family polar landmark protein [Rheinheimera maricola]|uniref:Pilus assembly protein FimV n=1 Tax=Rheinheimera maricola TaxID=2793282 RepID=A0ABS7X943_9GAMM|nr:FimV/HubP family polar landmark protein [Rheinheimera maricola]MBZ9612061.1 hypothetical protein [Rheinheimera maricola]
MPWLFILVITVFVNFSAPLLAQENTVQIRGPRSADTPQKLGPLSPSDTLWRVAERVRPDSNISMYQVMYAFYLKNPDAFLDDNLNHLKPGATLLVPSAREMRQADLTLARQKSERDDELWAQRSSSNDTSGNAGSATSVAKASNTSGSWQSELKNRDERQRQELDAIRSQFANSMQVVDSIADENLQLKTSLAKVQHELELIKAALADDSEIQQQIEQLLSQQAELLQAKAEQDAAAKAAVEESIDWQSLFKNPLTWVLAACVPALLILLGVLLWVKSRSRRTEKVLHAANVEPTVDPTYKSPLPPLDETDELDESLFEIDDALLEDAFADDGMTASSGAVDDDLLEFNDDELSFEDDSLLPATAAASATEGQLDDDFAFDADNILSDDDLSALLAAEDDDDAIIELADDIDDIDGDSDALAIDDDVPAAEATPETPSNTDDDALNADEWTVDDDSIDDKGGIDDEDGIEEFDIDDLIEEVSLDNYDELDALTEQEQEMQAVLQAKDNSVDNAQVVQQLEPEELLADIDLAVEDDSISLSLDDEPYLESEHNFDSSELDEFAESLVAESEAETTLEVSEFDLSNDEESLLSAELAELLDQVDAIEETEGVTDDVIAEITPEDIGLEQTEQDSMALNEQDNSDDMLLDTADDDDKTLINLDLSVSDDPSFSKPSEAALSVENPSKILDQYPELELLDDELLAEQDFSIAQDAVAADGLADSELEIELDPLPDAQFDSLMTELEAMAGNLDFAETDTQIGSDFDLTNDSSDTEQVVADDFNFNDDDFVEIDTLLDNADQQPDQDRFNHLNVDVGLDEFADIIGEHEQRDVDIEDNGYAAKLDLVRAYIEIDDTETAELLLNDILASDAPDNVKLEAEKLKHSE